MMPFNYEGVVELVFFILVISSSIILIDYRSKVFVFKFFWFPLVAYVVANIIIIRLLSSYVSSKAKKWELGYIFKASNKIIRFLSKKKEVIAIMKGVRYDQPHSYVCKCDKKVPKEERTIFKVRFLTADEQAEIRDEMYKISGIGAGRQERLLTGSSSLMALKKGLLGWENFKYEDTGEPIEFSVDNFSCIAPAERDEIANYIRGIEETEL